MEGIENAVNKLQAYIESREYRGYDPYDGLEAPILRRWPLRKATRFRFYFQQFNKRFPLNLRPVLGIRKGRNPVTLGLCIQAYCNRIRAGSGNRHQLEEKISDLILELEKMIPPGFSGSCWGYDFDWQARYASIPAFQPTVVATGIITNALYAAYNTISHSGAANHVVSAARFVLKDLNRSYDASGKYIAFSYSPFDREVVFNASMKGVRILAQARQISGNAGFMEDAEKAVAFVMQHQREDGAWKYSNSPSGGWTDNYHTGYILDCLDDYIRISGDRQWEQGLRSGYSYYKVHFLTNDNIPKFYDQSLYPVDCTAAAQTLLTLCRFGDRDKARAVCAWMIENMQDAAGYFYFRRYRYFTSKISFMRWSNAWMFAGMTGVLAGESSSNAEK
ncbi:MAG: delta-aminolevulinic acid dehydratase [Bacteroidia bacterium]|nr:delta-aminolevulinic acid dehydratase [Bacteroidia bacterium]